MRGQARTGNLRTAGHWLRLGLCLGLGLGWASLSCGCVRPFYRKAADKEVEEVLTEKNQFPDWAIKNWYVYPDPRARFADPTNPDHPPMPPDDPAAHDMAPNPQHPGKYGPQRIEGTGYLEILAEWDRENRAKLTARGQKPLYERARAREQARQTKEKTMTAGSRQAERANARPLEPFTSGPQPFVINMQQAVQMGLINSREYQDRREDLYLTALPVTLERFSFAAQFFFLEQVIGEWSGRETPMGRHNRWTFNTTTGLSKLFSTGALLLFNIANTTIIELTGPNKGTISTSILNLNLIQPFLRGGGKAVTLEPLTQSERNLVYFIRTYARFRKEFFVSIAGGGGGSISGGAFIPTGVITPNIVTPSAFFASSGLIPGVIDNNGTANPNGLSVNPGTSGRLVLTTAIAPNVSGFLGSMLQGAQIAIDQENIDKLTEILKLMEATKEGGDISQLQVDQTEQQLLTGYSSLYLDQQQYQDNLDRFKLQLGLPEDLPLELDDSDLQPVIEQFRRFEQILRQFRTLGDEAGKFRTSPVDRLRADLHRLATTTPLVAGTTFRTRIPGKWADWEKLMLAELRERQRRLAAEKKKLLDLQAERLGKGTNLTAAELKRLAEVLFQINLGDFEGLLREYESQPWNRLPDEAARQQAKVILFRSVIGAFVQVLVEARNERLEIVAKQWPELPRVCVEGKDLLKTDLEEAEAVVDRTTLANRLDLMNARGQLVDAWRQIAVFANALLGTFNVQYNLTSFTPLMQAKPLAFGGSRTDNRIIFNAELPLVRKLERNNYRACLIAFQRQRRLLMDAEDLSMNAVRGEIRQLRQYYEQYKIQQRQVELAYLTVENSLDVFAQPPQPGGVPAADATRAAALVQQILAAQRSLPTAQNQLLTFWTNYLVTRLQLYRDLELMPLDPRGVWIDDVANTCDDGTGSCGSAQDRKLPPVPERRPAGDERPVPVAQGAGER
jgi:hypothetical protein